MKTNKVHFNSIDDSTAKTFFTAKTAKNTKKFLRY